MGAISGGAVLQEEAEAEASRTAYIPRLIELYEQGRFTSTV
jgi:hypothetical protein